VECGFASLGCQPSGLLGLTGFFDDFEVAIAAYDQWVDLRPVDR
jgi:hypothetical protein